MFEIAQEVSGRCEEVRKMNFDQKGHGCQSSKVLDMIMDNQPRFSIVEAMLVTPVSLIWPYMASQDPYTFADVSFS
jgi:hypothetical protein